MRVNGKEWRAVGWDSRSGAVWWIDQLALPFRFATNASRDPEVVAQAIESMEVRGAPTIGATAAWGLALAANVDRSRFEQHWLPRFRRTRPTAVNLFHACDVLAEGFSNGLNGAGMVELAQSYADREVENNRLMGVYMAELLAVGERRIRTHCNAGWLATVDWGTATSGIYQLARAGENPFVWVDETRPRLQGMRLTAWELQQEGVSCAVEADGAAAWRMALGEVDAVVVGADRIAANGDVANKIGTYALSLAAKEHGIPFYVVAPTSTFDMATQNGRTIPIEERSSDEVVTMDGVDESGELRRIAIAPAGCTARNPAFDVTPSANITAIVSELGIWKPAGA